MVAFVCFVFRNCIVFCSRLRYLPYALTLPDYCMAPQYVNAMFARRVASLKDVLSSCAFAGTHDFGPYLPLSPSAITPTMIVNLERLRLSAIFAGILMLGLKAQYCA